MPIFTDGSKSDGHVGCGVVFPSDTLSYRLNNCCSVFTAELVAIFCALQEISPSSQRNFIIYTDSMSALETLSHYDNRLHPVALEILSVLQFLRNKGFNIIFCWVPSHVGISGNETADIIARFASDFLPRALPYCDIKKFLISHLLSVWQQKWNLLTNNKLYSVKPSIGLWSALPMRELDVKLTRLRIGHTRFTHRHLFLGQRAPRCPTCQADFTVQHILIECPSFKCHREYHFNPSSVTLQDLVEARKLVNSQTPTPGNSYVSVAKKSFSAPSAEKNPDISISHSKPPDSIARASPLITNLPIPSSPSVSPVIEETLASPDLTDFTLVKSRKKLKKDSPNKTSNTIATAEKISKFYTTSHREVRNPVPAKDNISTRQSVLKPLATPKPTSVDTELPELFPPQGHIFFRCDGIHDPEVP
ncbi:hypothetical protein AVEN_238271-1 [Araneus ventricosus]|uniref:RNase H type-1 domain-containing protein n=1 Tax=Araneus ventricosus TaxID=182803 RepID=A0A4Y2LUJ9_ARAVE|nr:hypothetical protein AVEN_238271-1 [Araneus ventricosus]